MSHHNGIPREVAVVVNPTSGSGRGMRLLPALVRQLAERGIHAHVRISTSAADLAAGVAGAVADDRDAVVVVGGDGSIHTAVQELSGTGVPMAILPVGSGDDNARSLGIPRRDPAALVDLIARGSRREVDLGEVQASGGPTEAFLGVLSVGFDSEVNERANRLIRLPGRSRYLVAILAELSGFRAVDATIRVDGITEQAPTMLVAVGNGISYGGGMRVCPSADPGDGLLDVTWLHRVGRARFIASFPRVFAGTHVHEPFVRTLRGTSVEIDAPGQTVYADGERIGPAPARIGVRRGALTVVAPASPGGA